MTCSLHLTHFTALGSQALTPRSGVLTMKKSELHGEGMSFCRPVVWKLGHMVFLQ